MKLKIKDLNDKQAEIIAINYARSFVEVIAQDGHGSACFEVPDAFPFKFNNKNEKVFISACKKVSDKLFKMIEQTK